MNRDEQKRRLAEELTDVTSQKDSLLWHLNGEPDEHDEYEEDRDPYADVDKLQRKEDKLKAEIRRIEIEEDNEKKIANFDSVIKSQSAIIDKESEVDLLGRSSQANVIARLIANKQTVAPLAIGIYGKWGRGKSTFVRLIQNNLDEINKKIAKNDSTISEYNKSYIVEFNPTEYDDHKLIWYAILKEMYMKYDAEKGIKGRIAFAFRNLFFSPKISKLPYILSAILLVLNIVVCVLFFGKYDSTIEFIEESKLSINLFATGLFITTFVQLIVPFIKKVLFIIKPLSSKVLQHMLIPDYKAKLGTREEVKQSLDDLLKIWLKKNENIILVVDELDRCSEKTIVEFFSALQLFIASDSIIKLISMNEEVVALALANNNQFILKDSATREDKIAFGRDYLKKYISIPVHLNRHSNYNHFIETLLGSELIFFNEEEKQTIARLINEIAKVIDVTPREIKRIINLLVLSKENVVTRFGDLKHKITYLEYIKWFFVYYFNPRAAKFFVDNINKSIYYEQYKYMEFKQMYPLFLISSKAKDEQTIRHLKTYLDMKIEVIIASDYLIRKSLTL
ncbi:KAP family P-loop NTPase fold protein [Cohnella mopanensis]|uniref:KAP family P-loop NTPase fold protein n=1 Tax=Cohnella mopanensis TaxID=2911966 RepID=UPI001EF7626E|nr:P-loop NTPase fold protein [Cohnella mopanensis]